MREVLEEVAAGEAEGEEVSERFGDLTPAQERVMQWLRGGHRARREYGNVVYVNGGRVGTVATLRALEKRRLVVYEKVYSVDTWKEWRPENK